MNTRVLISAKQEEKCKMRVFSESHAPGPPMMTLTSIIGVDNIGLTVLPNDRSSPEVCRSGDDGHHQVDLLVPAGTGGGLGQHCLLLGAHQHFQAPLPPPPPPPLTTVIMPDFICILFTLAVRWIFHSPED